jgi:uncharacterized protein (DUF302 family)
MTDTSIEYGMRTHVDLPYEVAVAKVTAALKEQGFGVLTEIDVRATMKQKLDADFRRYIILGACNPPLAHQALSTELEIGLLLPCNVIVYEDESGAGATISIIDPIMMLGMGINPRLESVADEANTRLRKVLDALEAA